MIAALITTMKCLGACFPVCLPSVLGLPHCMFTAQLDRVVIMVERFRLDVNKVDGDGKTVIHIAASHRHCHDVSVGNQRRCERAGLQLRCHCTHHAIPGTVGAV